jgi:hypothetical protein
MKHQELLLAEIQNLDNTRKVEESIELTRRYKMSAYTTPRSVSRLEESTLRAIESTLSKQEHLEKPHSPRETEGEQRQPKRLLEDLDKDEH